MRIVAHGQSQSDQDHHDRERGGERRPHRGRRPALPAVSARHLGPPSQHSAHVGECLLPTGSRPGRPRVRRSSCAGGPDSGAGGPEPRARPAGAGGMCVPACGRGRSGTGITALRMQVASVAKHQTSTIVDGVPGMPDPISTIADVKIVMVRARATGLGGRCRSGERRSLCVRSAAAAERNLGPHLFGRYRTVLNCALGAAARMRPGSARTRRDPRGQGTQRDQTRWRRSRRLCES